MKTKAIMALLVATTMMISCNKARQTSVTVGSPAATNEGGRLEVPHAKG